MHIEETFMKLNLSFFIKVDESLEKYNEIWGKKVKNSLRKEFDSEPVYNKKYLKVKIKSYSGEINTNFHNTKLPKEGSQLICLLVILINSVFETGKNCYSQVLLEECKYVFKDKKILRYIIDDTEISDSDREDSDEENSNE